MSMSRKELTFASGQQACVAALGERSARIGEVGSFDVIELIHGGSPVTFKRPA